MSAAVACIGTELVRGEIVNTNASWLAERLTAEGVEVAAIETVGDEPSTIRATLRRLGQEHSLIVCTGGLGPTSDDVTTQSVASLLGLPLERDGTTLAAIEARLARFGRTMAASNAKQADVPQGARVLPNEQGTAPGFSIQVGRALAFFLPGVPAEMRAMFCTQVAPALPPRDGKRTAQVRLRTFGLPESAVNDRLEGLEAQFGVKVGYRAHFPEIEVRLLGRDDDEDRARQLVRRAADEVVRRLGPEVAFGEGETGLAEVVGRLLAQRGLRLALAESCTGGLLAELITEVPGASAHFAGGAVTYSNHAKQALLGVDAALLAEHGAVSVEVARAMARGARARFAADIGLALTGIAGPSGGSTQKPVGTVHCAVATADGCEDATMFHPGTRRQVRLRAAYCGLALVRRLLLRTAGGD
jgi:nicotinamide-nucleotide amidase